MVGCKKCGSLSINWSATGISKKTNKPFSGPKCNGCGTWNFDLRQETTGQINPPGAVAPSQPKINETVNVLKDIRTLLQKLVELNGGKVVIFPDELQPDDNVPF